MQGTKIVRLELNYFKYTIFKNQHKIDNIILSKTSLK